MIETCEVQRDPRECECITGQYCYKCGMPACDACSIKFVWGKHVGQRIGLDCLDDMARFNELDYLTLASY